MLLDGQLTEPLPSAKIACISTLCVLSYLDCEATVASQTGAQTAWALTLAHWICASVSLSVKQR